MKSESLMRFLSSILKTFHIHSQVIRLKVSNSHKNALISGFKNATLEAKSSVSKCFFGFLSSYFSFYEQTSCILHKLYFNVSAGLIDYNFHCFRKAIHEVFEVGSSFEGAAWRPASSCSNQPGLKYAALNGSAV